MADIRLKVDKKQNFCYNKPMENLFQEYLESAPQRFCKKCGKCCKITGCNYIGDDNLCQIYENRPQACKDFPSSPFEVLPEGCGYEGWIFQKREMLKQQVRKQKELLLPLEIMLKTANDEEAIKIKKDIAEIKKLVDSYAKYGSADW